MGESWIVSCKPSRLGGSHSSVVSLGGTSGNPFLTGFGSGVSLGLNPSMCLLFASDDVLVSVFCFSLDFPGCFAGGLWRGTLGFRGLVMIVHKFCCICAELFSSSKLEDVGVFAFVGCWPAVFCGGLVCMAVVAVR